MRREALSGEKFSVDLNKRRNWIKINRVSHNIFSLLFFPGEVFFPFPPIHVLDFVELHCYSFVFLDDCEFSDELPLGRQFDSIPEKQRVIFEQEAILERREGEQLSQ